MSAEFCGIEGCTCPDPPTPPGNYPCLDCGQIECQGDCQAPAWMGRGMTTSNANWMKGQHLSGNPSPRAADGQEKP